MTFKLSRKGFFLRLLTCRTSALKSPLQFQHPIKPQRHESLYKPQLYSIGYDACLAVCNYIQKQVIFTFFKRRALFSLSLFFFLSAAARSQGLVVSVWWCNAVTVLLQSSRKASATAFRPALASNKDTYTAQHRCLSGFTERRRAEAKGGERKCQVLLMKYRTVPNVGAGSSPKQIWMQTVHVTVPICERTGTKHVPYIFTVHFFLCPHTSSATSSTECVHFLNHSWEQLALLRNSDPHQ